jgi:hypothetical protein
MVIVSSGWQSIALPQGCVQQGCWTQVYKDVFTTSLEARRLTAYRFRARFYPLNGDADETMTMALIHKLSDEQRNQRLVPDAALRFLG